MAKKALSDGRRERAGTCDREKRLLLADCPARGESLALPYADAA